MKKKVIWLALLIGTLTMLTACKELPEVGSADVTPNEWQLILDSSEKTTLNVYHDYKDKLAITWMDSIMTPYVQEQLGIKVVLNPLNVDEYLKKLKTEKINEVAIGNADLFILTESGFAKLKDAGVLYGPFKNKLPNVSLNQVGESYEMMWLDGKPIDNLAVQIGKNQLTLFFDEDVMEVPPMTVQELRKYAKDNPGKFTFPSLSTPEGKAFVGTLAATLCDQKKLYETNLSAADQAKLFAPVLTYLKDVQPSMWMQGKQLPKTIPEMDQLFKSGQIGFSMGLNQNWATNMIKEEKFPDGAKAFVLSTGTTGYGQYAAIPFNSANKSGAMAMVNTLLSGEMQGSKYNPKNWGNLPSVDPMKMEKTESAKITKVSVKRNALKEEELAAARLPQIPSDKLTQLVSYLKKNLGI